MLFNMKKQYFKKVEFKKNLFSFWLLFLFAFFLVGNKAIVANAYNGSEYFVSNSNPIFSIDKYKNDKKCEELNNKLKQINDKENACISIVVINKSDFDKNKSLADYGREYYYKNFHDSSSKIPGAVLIISFDSIHNFDFNIVLFGNMNKVLAHDSLNDIMEDMNDSFNNSDIYSGLEKYINSMNEALVTLESNETENTSFEVDIEQIAKIIAIVSVLLLCVAIIYCIIKLIVDKVKDSKYGSDSVTEEGQPEDGIVKDTEKKTINKSSLKIIWIIGMATFFISIGAIWRSVYWKNQISYNKYMYYGRFTEAYEEYMNIWVTIAVVFGIIAFITIIIAIVKQYSFVSDNKVVDEKQMNRDGFKGTDQELKKDKVVKKSNSSISDENNIIILKSYKKLLDDGVINQEEFERIKSRILEGGEIR